MPNSGARETRKHSEHCRKVSRSEDRAILGRTHRGRETVRPEYGEPRAQLGFPGKESLQSPDDARSARVDRQNRRCIFVFDSELRGGQRVCEIVPVQV